MGRFGVSYSDVSNTAMELQGEGINPTVDAVRERLKTGSRSTIGPYLKRWRLKQEESDPNVDGLPSELYSFTKGLYTKLQESAELRIKEIETTTNTEIAAIQERLNQLQGNNLLLQQEIQSLNSRLNAAALTNHQQKEMLDNLHITNLNLDLKNQTLEKRLQDKSQHIQTLEEQLSKVQENLLHYRETMMIQRETDLKIFEKELAALNQKITELNHENAELISNNKELKQKQEICLEQKHQLEKDWYEQRGKTMELQEKLKIKEYFVQELENKYNKISKDHQDTQMELTEKQMAFNQSEKDTLILKDRLTQAQTITRRAENTALNLHKEKLFLMQEINNLKMELKIK